MNGALVEGAQWRLVNVALDEVPHWRLVNGALDEAPHWRLVNVTPRCLVAGTQKQ